MLGQVLNHYQARHSIIHDGAQELKHVAERDDQFFTGADGAEQQEVINEDIEMQAVNEAIAIDTALLAGDEEGRALLEEQRQLHKEKRVFIDHQRKQHEQLMREHKEFQSLTNKIKQGGSGGKGGLEELLRECEHVLNHESEHPVFIELHKLIDGEQGAEGQQE